MLLCSLSELILSRHPELKNAIDFYKSFPSITQVRSTRSFFWHLIFIIGLGVAVVQTQAQQFVEITAQLEFDHWDNMFFFDGVNSGTNGSWPGYDGRPTLFPTNQIRRCVVGTNAWMIDWSTENSTNRYWFTGTNFISFHQNGAVKMVDATPSTDGNPGRPGGVADLMTFDTSGRIYWLALCSGKSMKEADRKIYPPSDLWKESAIYKLGWQDHVETFSDELGLPRRLQLTTTNNQAVLHYEAHKTTNAFDWTFPTEFFGVQYIGGGSRGWRVELTFKGKILSIKPATQRDVAPPESVESKPAHQ